MARRAKDPKPRRKPPRNGRSYETLPLLCLPDVTHTVGGAPADSYLGLQSAPREEDRRPATTPRPAIRTLVGVVMWHKNRVARGMTLPPRTLEWLRAWDNAAKPAGVELAVVANCDEFKEQDIIRNIIGDNVRLWLNPPLHFIPRNNEGRDIGALKHLIEGKFKEGDYTHLAWFTDDCLPMNKDFLFKFMQPFKDSRDYGLVGNYFTPKDYYPGIEAHVRTVCFMLRRDVALGLKFPPRLLTREDCYSFEYGEYNMTKQVLDMGAEVTLVHGNAQRPWYACNETVWDCGEIHAGVHWDWRRRQDHWAAYEAQFETHHAMQNT